MRSARRALVLAVALLAVFAGCTAPVADSQSEVADAETESVPAADRDGASEPIEDDSNESLEVRTGSLPFDGNRTLDRLETVLDVGIDPPTVYVEEPVDRGDATYRDSSSFFAVMGVPLPDPNDIETFHVGGAAGQRQDVYVLPSENASDDEIEQVLAHELTHAAQFQRNATGRTFSSIPADHRDTTDAQYVYLSLLEGSAVYAASTYADAHLADVEPEGERLARAYANASEGTKLQWGPYYHGSAYVAERADSPADHWEVYDDPPYTMRQVMDADPETGTESETDLEAFEATVASDGSDWRAIAVGTGTGDSDVFGAFVLRTVLETELAENRSEAAAAGWEYDRVRRFSSEEAAIDGYAWTVRAGDEANASTLEDAFAAYLASRSDEVAVDGAAIDGDPEPADRSDAVWFDGEYAFSLERLDDRTVAVIAGSPSFVGNASASPSNDDVVVEVGNATEPAVRIASTPASGGPAPIGTSRIAIDAPQSAIRPASVRDLRDGEPTVGDGRPGEQQHS